MDKSTWPQAWKDQYNGVIRKRNNEKVSRAAKDRILDQIYFPQISELKIDEESIFAMLAHRFPLNSVISRILQRFITDEHMKELILSPRYLYYTQKIFPGYYSDRERIVAIMNRFRVGGNIDEFINWVQFQTDKSTFHYIHLLIGTIFLDHYVDGPSFNEECLEISIRHLQIAASKLVRDDSKLAVNSLLAFGYYLDRDFDRAASYLDSKNSNLENDFIKLIKKVA